MWALLTSWPLWGNPHSVTRMPQEERDQQRIPCWVVHGLQQLAHARKTSTNLCKTSTYCHKSSRACSKKHKLCKESEWRCRNHKLLKESECHCNNHKTARRLCQNVELCNGPQSQAERRNSTQGIPASEVVCKEVC